MHKMTGWATHGATTVQDSDGKGKAESQAFAGVLCKGMTRTGKADFVSLGWKSLTNCRDLWVTNCSRTWPWLDIQQEDGLGMWEFTKRGDRWP